MRIFFLILFFLISFAGAAQEAVLLKGQILADSLEGSSINIVNLTRETGTTNNPSGRFEIVAGVGDELLFSSVQYEIVKVKISAKILEERFLKVQLWEITNELDEVHISNISLTGNLTQDLNNIQTFDPAAVGLPMRTRPSPTSIERKLKTSSGVQTASKKNPPGLVNVSLDGILNSINGRIAMLEKAKANETLAFQVDRGMNVLPASFFVEELQIPEEEIRNFVYFCAEDQGFHLLLPKEKRLELVEFYTAKASLFLSDRMGY